MEGQAIGLLIAIALLYFIPSVIAVGKGKTNAGAIVALNILLGWTLIGWVAALVWSLCEDKSIVEQQPTNSEPDPW